MRRPRLAIVDMAVAQDSPAGSCVLAEVQGLAERFDVTVFGDRFERGADSRVEFIRVRAPTAPVLLRYIVFHLSVPLHYLSWRLRNGRPDCLQATQGQLPGADICYAHFCHRSYLKHQWRQGSGTGLRRLSRWAVHRFNAACEARAMRRARWIVVPSHGLAREISTEYPAAAARLRVIANPVAIEHFARADGFDRAGQRAGLDLAEGDLVLGFMALGDFARKGLGLLIAALAALRGTDRDRARIVVIGGQPGEIAEFAASAAQLGVADRLRFVGLQRDVRPYLWACDVFAFPSIYETFGLAVAQAAAAGLAVMVCEGVHGLEEFVVDGKNGWILPRSQAAVTAWLERVLAGRDALPAMGRIAAESVRPYARDVFQARWGLTVDAVLRGDAPQAMSATA